MMALPESAVGMSVAFKPNIDAYFERIGFAGSIAPTLETLSQLHALHPAAIPYENLDPLMGAPVRLDLPNLQQKLVFDRRGGYCFEHNTLLRAILEDLDFEVKVHGARVIWGTPEGEEPPLRHIVLTMDVAGVPYLCDVGFGGNTATAPLRLRSGVEQETPLNRYRLTEADGVWLVEIEVEGEWLKLYDFTLAELGEERIVELNDIADSSEFFTTELLAARIERTRRLALGNTRLNIHTPGQPSEGRTLGSVAELREVLSGTMGIALPADERLDLALQKIVDRGAA
jgi:N-hydroxyarylamine O-acetyltransferase